MRIIVDVMGGDHAPHELIKGVVSASEQYTANFILVGDRAAIEAVAELALERNTGARGLRSIMEGIMTGIMYDIPSRDDIAEVHITADCVKKKSEPILVKKVG